MLQFDLMQRLDGVFTIFSFNGIELKREKNTRITEKETGHYRQEKKVKFI